MNKKNLKLSPIVEQILDATHPGKMYIRSIVRQGLPPISLKRRLMASTFMNLGAIKP